MSGHEKPLGMIAKPVPVEKRNRCGLWQAAQRLGRTIYCPVKDSRCGVCAYHFDPTIQKDTMPTKTEFGETKEAARRKAAREAQRLWYQEHRTGVKPGRPSPVPEDIRKTPQWTRIYARFFAQIKRALSKLDPDLKPIGKLKLAAAIAPFVLNGDLALPDKVRLEDHGGQVWEYDTASCKLRCLTREKAVLAKIKGNKRRVQAG